MCICVFANVCVRVCVRLYFVHVCLLLYFVHMCVRLLFFKYAYVTTVPDKRDHF